MRIDIQRLSFLSVSAVFAFFAEMAVAITATPTLPPTATYTPTSMPTNRYTPTVKPTPTPAVFDLNRRAHSGTQARWHPVGNSRIWGATCEIVQHPVHGTVQCPSTLLSDPPAPGQYLSNPGFSGTDSFKYRARLANGELTNVATVMVDVKTPCTGNKCYALKKIDFPDIASGLIAGGRLIINDLGNVAGGNGLAYYRTANDGKVTKLNDFLTPILGFEPGVSAVRLNNSGKLLVYAAGGAGRHYVIDLVSGEVRGIPDVGVRDMNNAGLVLFSTLQYCSGFLCGVVNSIWDPLTGLVVDLSQEPSWPSSEQIPQAWLFNDSGQIVIWPVRSSTASFWEKSAGVFTVGDFFPTHLNNLGQVVGIGHSLNTGKAYIWEKNLGIKELGFFSTQDPSSNNDPRGLSDTGTVVGMSASQYMTAFTAPIFNQFYSNQPFPPFQESYVWDSTTGLNPLFERTHVSGAGWDVVPYGVSNNGLIVGMGQNVGSVIPEMVVLTPISAPTASDISLSGPSKQLLSWTPVASDPDGVPLSCRIVSPPMNGTATVASDCLGGNYQSYSGFIGTDSFTYVANNGSYDSNSALVTVAVTDGPIDQNCVKVYPVSQFSQTGKDGSLTITFTGNITSHTNKEVKVCPGTTLKYQTTSTQGPVFCKFKNNTTRGSGLLRINDHIKCTDKPAGKDKVGFKVKSGVK